MTNSFVVPSQSGRTAIVTGASSGIGLWTAAGLARAGAHVVMVCRNPERGEEAKTFVSRLGGPTPDLVLADFADLKAVEDAAATISARYPQIHILVNNAGLFSLNRELTKDGYEMTFAVNHLAPFLFTNKLLPALERSGEQNRHARIVTVASAAANSRYHRIARSHVNAALQHARRVWPIEACKYSLHKRTRPAPAAPPHLDELPASWRRRHKDRQQGRHGGACVVGDKAFRH